MGITVVPLLSTQLTQDRREARDGVVGEVGVRDVPLNAGNAQNAAQRAAPPDAYGVPQRRLAGWFAEQAPVDFLVTRNESFHDL